MLDPVLLSRLQFFWVISFHILLPAFTVGLACYIAVLDSLYLKTRDHTYFRVSVFWTRIFAVSFGLGVVSGIVMPFQFGTNWSRFSDAAANVIGPLMAYEGLTAFFLEASFLGVLLFGRKLVPPWAALLCGRHGCRFGALFPRSGSWRSIHGCKLRPGTKSSMAGSMRSTGLLSSSIRLFHSGFHTLLRPFW